jgi:1,3-beta-glucan synthase
MVGPSLAGKYVPSSLFKMLDSTNLVQPTGLDNNNTIGETETGTGNPSYTGALLTMTGASSGAAASSTGDAAKIRLF